MMAWLKAALRSPFRSPPSSAISSDISTGISFSISSTTSVIAIPQILGCFTELLPWSHVGELVVTEKSGPPGYLEGERKGFALPCPDLLKAATRRVANLGVLSFFSFTFAGPWAWRPLGPEQIGLPESSGLGGKWDCSWSCNTTCQDRVHLLPSRNKRNVLSAVNQDLWDGLSEVKK